MAYNTKAIKTDVNAKPIPQYYNPVTDEYEVLQGADGAARQVLYDSQGNPLSIVDSKLAVRASELEDLLTEKQDALAALVGALDSSAVDDPSKSGAVIALLKGLISRIQNLEGKIDAITEDGNVKTQLTGSKVAVEEYILADRDERRTAGTVYYPDATAPALDVSHLGAKSIKIENMHNQAVSVDLYAFTSYGTFGSIDEKPGSIAAGTKMVLWSKDYPWLNEPMMKMRIYTNYTVAPTEGYLSIVMVGEPR
jgi:hypothetical protein